MKTRSDMVPNIPIREAVLAAIDRGELEGFQDLSRRLGYAGHNTSRVPRMLGLVKSWGGRQANGGVRPPQCATDISYENAVAIIRALHLDPVDFDL